MSDRCSVWALTVAHGPLTVRSRSRTVRPRSAHGPLTVDPETFCIIYSELRHVQAMCLPCARHVHAMCRPCARHVDLHATYMGAHGLHMACAWPAHGCTWLHMVLPKGVHMAAHGCTWLAHGLHMARTCRAHAAHMTCTWRAHADLPLSHMACT